MQINEVKALVAAQDKAQQAAAKAAREAHQKAQEAAQELRDELTVSIDHASERETLKALIEDAARKVMPKASHALAGVVVGQFASALADQPGISASVSRSGAELVARSVSGTVGYPADQRQQVIAALVVGSTEKGIQTGLITLPDDWHEKPSLAALWQMAEILDSDAVAGVREQHAEQAAKLAEAQRYCDALSQAAPKLFTVGENVEALAVTIRCNRSGALTIGEVTFQAGDNEISADDFASIRGHRAFDAYKADGVLEVVSTGELAKEVA